MKDNDKIPVSAWIGGILFLIIVFGYVPFLKFLMG